MPEIRIPDDFNKVKLSVLKNALSKSAKIRVFSLLFLTNIFRKDFSIPLARKIYFN